MLISSIKMGWLLLLAAISFIFGYMVSSPKGECERVVEIVEKERIVVDTIYITDIAPIKIERDTITITKDSIIYSPISTYTFGESGEWGAQVRGREVELESIWFTEKSKFTNTKTIIAPRWELQALTAVAPSSCWMGLATTHHFNNKVLTIGIGYDLWRSSPHLEARFGVVLFKR